MQVSYYQHYEFGKMKKPDERNVRKGTINNYNEKMTYFVQKINIRVIMNF